MEGKAEKEIGNGEGGGRGGGRGEGGKALILLVICILEFNMKNMLLDMFSISQTIYLVQPAMFRNIYGQ